MKKGYPSSDSLHIVCDRSEKAGVSVIPVESFVSLSRLSVVALFVRYSYADKFRRKSPSLQSKRERDEETARNVLRSSLGNMRFNLLHLPFMNQSTLHSAYVS